MPRFRSPVSWAKEKLLNGLLGDQSDKDRLLIQLLDDLPPFMPLQVFYKVCEKFIMPGVDVAFIRKLGQVPEILLCKRPADDPFFPRMWHLTGGIVVREQTAHTTMEKVSVREVGIPLPRTPTFRDVRDIGMGPPGPHVSPRGSEVYRLYDVVLENGEDAGIIQNDGRKFFPLDQIPTNLIAHHWPSIELLRTIHG